MGQFPILIQKINIALNACVVRRMQCFIALWPNMTSEPCKHLFEKTF